MHVNAQKAEVQRLLADDRIVTMAQLTRAGLARGKELLAYPDKLRTTMVRVNDSSSYREVTYVARNARLLDVPLRELSHAAGLSELETLRPLALGELHGRLSPLPKHQAKNGRPDAVIWRVESGAVSSQVAIEVDLGYPHATLMAKIKAIDAQQIEFMDPASGKRRLRRVYEGYVIATSIHSRVASLKAEVLAAYRHPSGEVLQNLAWVEIIWIDFWSPTNRYVGRPNCHKSNREHVTLM